MAVFYERNLLFNTHSLTKDIFFERSLCNAMFIIDNYIAGNCYRDTVVLQF